jgi:hypothetical protein
MNDSIAKSRQRREPGLLGSLIEADLVSPPANVPLDWWRQIQAGLIIDV